MIRVLIADDHPIFRDGLRRLIDETPGLAVVGEAATGLEVIEGARKLRPDVILCDVVMPGRGAVEVLQELRRQVPGAAILMLTGQPEDHFALRCLKEGAAGYMTKGAATEELIDAIRKISIGGKYISSGLAERLVSSLDPQRDASPHEKLSDREFQVMCAIAAGRAPKDIAAELCLSVKTVSTYRARILEKMSLKNNAEIMRYAVREGLIH